MAANSSSNSFWLFMILPLALQLSIHCKVTYDRKALIINGQRRILFSGSIHYPRSSPDMWEGLIKKAKDGGLDVIDTYVFWNVHETSPGNYNFEGRYDLVRFIKLVKKAGLYVNLRIGPYICAEWNFGGFPVWLKFVPGISFRTDNEPFKLAMRNFTQKIVHMMKDEKLFQSQGGPIILSQIENEYEPERKEFGTSGQAYMEWAAKMAVSLDTGVPWIMCKDEDVPDPVFFFVVCLSYKHSAMVFTVTVSLPTNLLNPHYGLRIGVAGFQNLVAQFTNDQSKIWHLQLLDSFKKEAPWLIITWSYHGGTNFGRTAGGPFITTSYDYDAPIDEYVLCCADMIGLIREPKYSHLMELHKAIKLCERALLAADPNVTNLGDYEQVHVFSSKSGHCAAFLSNYNTESAARVTFNKKNYNLPPWSISILPDCKNVVFNTANVSKFDKVKTKTSHVQMLSTNIDLHSWETFNEDIFSSVGDSTITVSGLLEQLNITRDTSDYLWYSTSVNISSSETFLNGGQHPTLTAQSRGHAMHVFVNGHFTGSASGTRQCRRFTFTGNVKLDAGINRISLLSITAGLTNLGAHFESYETGVLGPVVLHGLDEGKRDLSWKKWSYKSGLKGETINSDSRNGIPVVDWRPLSLAEQKQQLLTWYKAKFDAPEGDEPLALDMGSMTKGQVWINGQSIGRYWTATANGNCSVCSYSGTYRPTRCQSGCDQPTQQWYHVPRSWLEPKENSLIVFEEIGGDPSKISLVKRLVKK
ncbi:hypothetical protein JRO89_XS02G0036400 [Xanthoceras sorbifolium]|uniref:Beta-galactosidase n=1 Tax=Xanthoceras sorbifolium TaxID=99658 RepID=A0ABQ8IF11_9ROSI|nr:hypothetical protein JRO89_XS02G0036400 [Xanthoceras sorbifolium]